MASGDGRDSDDRNGGDGDLTRRRFVQACLVVATGAAVGSTVASIVGLRPEFQAEAPPPSHEGIAVCPVCSIGCGLLSVTSRGAPFPSRGDPKSSATKGMVCTRGALPPASAWPSTVATPLERISPTSKGTPPSPDQFRAVTWEDALKDLANRLAAVGKDFGASSRGCILGGNVPLEDAYLAAKVWKGALESPSIDTVESIHSRATEAVYIEQLGALAPPVCYDDVGLADLIVVVGEDLAVTHPVLYANVVEAVVTRGATLVVIDPRATATSMRTQAVHVPVIAGGETTLLNAVGHVLVHDLGAAPTDGAREQVLNVDAFAEFLALYDPKYDFNQRVDADWVGFLGNRDGQGYLKSFDVPTITGVPEEQVRDLAQRWHRARNVVTIWSSRLAGVGDGGAAVSSILNLHLLTGQVGRPGAGPLGLHVTASGRGAFDAGASPLTLPGGSPAGGEAPPMALFNTWGQKLSDRATQLPPGLGVMEILRRASNEKMPLLFLLGGGVSPSLPDRDMLVVPALLAAYVVAMTSHLEDPDVAYANLVLPAPSWFEREAHYISSDRRVARSLASLPRPEGTRSGPEVLSVIGFEQMADETLILPSSFLAMDELRSVSEDAPADMSELPLGDDLTATRGVQWPVATERSATLKGTARRHMGQDGAGGGFPTETGRALIHPREHPGIRQAVSPDFPLKAVVSLDAATWWDGQMVLPSGSDVVRPRDVEPAYVEVTAEDAEELGLLEGDLAQVTSATGTLHLPVRLAAEGSRKGHVFLPWGGDVNTQVLAPSFPLDRNGCPPWTVFPIRLEPAVLDGG